MQYQHVLKILTAAALAVCIAACGKQANNNLTGCCQVSEGSCASPVTEAQCDEMSGRSFHEGGTCRTPQGVCGVLQE